MTVTEANSEFLNEERLAKIGRVNGELLRRGGYWIHRRKESVAIMDDTAVQRTVSVDFTLPEQIEGENFDAVIQEPDGGEPVYCPPLFVLPKASKDLMAFDLRSETGASLPLMTRRDNARVSGETLVAIAKRVLEESLSSTLNERLVALATSHTVRPVAAERLKHSGRDDLDFDQLATLCKDPVFDWWLWTLAHSSLVGVPYRDPTVRRKIFVLSYIESFERTLRVPTRFGWTPYKVVIDSPWIGARNFHFEAEAPPGLRIAKAILGAHKEDTAAKNDPGLADAQERQPSKDDSALVGGKSDATSPEGRPSSEDSVGQECATDVGDPTSFSSLDSSSSSDLGERVDRESGLAADTGGKEQASLMATENLREVDPDRATKGLLRRVHLSRYEAAQAGADTATLDLRVSGPGFVGGGMLACALVLGAMVVCLVQVHAVARFPTSAPAALLLLPGVIATYVGRSDGHALTTRLLLFARWLLLLAALAAYGCAVVVALGGEAPRVGLPATGRVDQLEIAFWIGGGLAAISLAGLAIGWMLANPTIRDFLREAIYFRWVKQAWEALKRAHFAHSIALPVSSERLRQEIHEHRRMLLKLDKDRRKSDKVAAEKGPPFHREDRSGYWTLHLDVTEVDGEVELTLRGTYLPRRMLWPARPLLVRREKRAAGRRLKEYGKTLKKAPDQNAEVASEDLAAASQPGNDDSA